MSLASYQLLHSAMFKGFPLSLRVQRYYIFPEYANFHVIFLHISMKKGF